MKFKSKTSNSFHPQVDNMVAYIRSMVSILRKISDPLCFMMMKPCLDKSPGWCFPSPRGMKVYQDDQDLNCFMKRLKELVLSDEDLKGSQSSSLQLLEGVYKHHRTKLLVVGNGKTSNGQKWFGMSKEDIILL